MKKISEIIYKSLIVINLTFISLFLWGLNEPIVDGSYDEIIKEYLLETQLYSGFYDPFCNSLDTEPLENFSYEEYLTKLKALDDTSE